MTERPILFSGTMVRALLDGCKTQTRRQVAHLTGVARSSHFGASTTPGYDWQYRDRHAHWQDITHESLLRACPYGQVGDHLWVRETFALHHQGFDDGAAFPVYRADREYPSKRWTPPIHMPRAVSRITLELTDVRVKQLQAITDADAMAEGITVVPFRPDDGHPLCDGYMAGPDDGTTALHTHPVKAFQALWESINGHDSWAANPWVWAITFRRVDQAAAA